MKGCLGIAGIVGLAFAVALAFGAGVGLGRNGILSSQLAQAQTCGADGTTAGTAPSDASLSDAIKADAGGNAKLALSMLVGSYLESKWDVNAKNQTATGAFQIVLSVHHDVSDAQARNPAFAANYMLPSYKSGVNGVDPGLWTTDTERAAEEAAYAAEGPARSYYASQGSTAVHNAYTASVAEMKRLGLPLTFGSSVEIDTASLQTQPVQPTPSTQSVPGTGNGAAIPNTAPSCTGQTDDSSLTNNLPPSSATGAAKRVLDTGATQLGVKYVFGAESPRRKGHAGAFDCSGFVQWTFSQAGIHLPRTAHEQYHATRDRKVPLSQAKPGDLIFFVTDGSRNNPGHVGIVYDPQKGIMIVAPHTGSHVKFEKYTTFHDIVAVTDPYGLAA